MALPILAAAAVVHGIRFAAFRIVPFIVKEVAKAAGKRGAKQVAKKATGKIVSSDYAVVITDPSKARYIREVFGKRVIANEKIIQANSTVNRAYEPLTKRVFDKTSPEVKNLILRNADDAATKASKVLSNPKVVAPNTGGTNIVSAFKEFFGKNFSLGKGTSEAVKVAQRGPLSTSKELVTTVPSASIKAAGRIGKEKAKLSKQGDVIKLGKLEPKVPKTGTDVAVTVTDRPWYVAMMPRFLKKDVVKTDVYPFVRTEKLTRGGKIALGGATVAAPYVAAGVIPDDKPIDTTPRIEGDAAGMFADTETDLQDSGFQQLETESGLRVEEIDSQGNFVD